MAIMTIHQSVDTGKVSERVYSMDWGALSECAWQITQALHHAFYDAKISWEETERGHLQHIEWVIRQDTPPECEQIILGLGSLLDREFKGPHQVGKHIFTAISANPYTDPE